MPYLPHLIALAGAWVIMTISPGPDFAVTLHYATARTRRDGVFVALGVATGLTIWITGSMAGLEILFARFSWLVEIIRTLGAVYLTYLGIKMILTAHRRPAPQLAAHIGTTRRFSSWRVGFLSNISNPKAAAFFTSLFASLLPANPPLWVFGVIVVMMLVITTGWLCIVVCVFTLGPVAGIYGRVKHWIDSITGAVLIALGLRLIIEK